MYRYFVLFNNSWATRKPGIYETRTATVLVPMSMSIQVTKLHHVRAIIHLGCRVNVSVFHNPYNALELPGNQMEPVSMCIHVPTHLLFIKGRVCSPDVNNAVLYMVGDIVLADLGPLRWYIWYYPDYLIMVSVSYHKGYNSYRHDLCVI
jgi:hypothetical protein